MCMLCLREERQRCTLLPGHHRFAECYSLPRVIVLLSVREISQLYVTNIFCRTFSKVFLEYQQRKIAVTTINDSDRVFAERLLSWHTRQTRLQCALFTSPFVESFDRHSAKQTSFPSDWLIGSRQRRLQWALLLVTLLSVVLCWVSSSLNEVYVESCSSTLSSVR